MTNDRTSMLTVVALCWVATTHVMASPNSWSPRLKNIDIWGDDSAPASSVPIGGRSDADDGVELIAGGGFRGNRQNGTGTRRDGRVLNFFPLPVDDECLADDGTRLGICLNKYECHIQGGTSRGQCALGFGVCCIFTATCGQEVFNNITYVISPSFPSLMTKDIKSCKLKIKMISAEVSQLRLDFVHFSMGQPNRSTGICDGDQFMLSGGASGEFMLCGQNHGQHMYYDVPAQKTNDSMTSREEPGDGVIDLIMNFSERFGASRLFEIRVTQIPFSQRAPAGCMQYFTAAEGIIQTFNFAENGRHLADQNYRACVRQEVGMCSIQYEPCHDQAFRIGPRRRRLGPSPMNPGSYLNSGNGESGSGIPGSSPATANPAGSLTGNPVGNSPIQAADAFVPGGEGAGANPVQAADASSAAAEPEVAATSGDETVEGSGGGDLPAVPSGGVPAADSVVAAAPAASANAAAPAAATPAAAAPAPALATPVPESSFFSFPSFTSFFTRGFFGGGPSGRSHRPRHKRRSHSDNGEYYSSRQSRQFFGSECTDRITLPCVVEDFIAAGMGNVPTCLPIHCGDNLCAAGVFPCRIESTVKPFGIGIHFGGVGDEEEKGSPEENIGACLRFNQVSC